MWNFKMSVVLEAQALEGQHSYISQFLDLWDKLSLLSKQHLKSVSYIIIHEYPRAAWYWRNEELSGVCNITELFL